MVYVGSGGYQSMIDHLATRYADSYPEQQAKEIAEQEIERLYEGDIRVTVHKSPRPILLSRDAHEMRRIPRGSWLLSFNNHYVIAYRRTKSEIEEAYRKYMAFLQAA